MFASRIHETCHVKFRYSLFAGPPPFEWIARKASAVSAARIETWFSDNLAIARTDLAKQKVLGITEQTEQQLEALVNCVYRELKPVVRVNVVARVFKAALA